MSTSKELWVYFFVGLAATLLMPALYPSLKLFYFIPFLIRSYYLKPLSTCLWFSLLVGLILDLLSANVRFGIYSFNYLLTTYVLYRMKRNFFEDSFIAMPSMTYFFSTISTLIQIVLLLILNRQVIPLSFRFVVTDVFLMPLADTAFTLLVYSFPTLLLGKPIRKGSDYFLEE